MNNYKITIKDNQIKIFINDIIHLCLKQDEVVGFQSWVEGDDDKKYIIEFYTKTTELFTEYDIREKWIDVLNLLNSRNILNRAL